MIDQKLRGAETPGYEVDFNPLEAEKLALREDALSAEEARECRRSLVGDSASRDCPDLRSAK
jgi:hypothetical protein